MTSFTKLHTALSTISSIFMPLKLRGMYGCLITFLRRGVHLSLLMPGYFLDAEGKDGRSQHSTLGRDAHSLIKIIIAPCMVSASEGICLVREGDYEKGVQKGKTLEQYNSPHTEIQDKRSSENCSFWDQRPMTSHKVSESQIRSQVPSHSLRRTEFHLLQASHFKLFSRKVVFSSVFIQSPGFMEAIWLKLNGEIQEPSPVGLLHQRLIRATSRPWQHSWKSTAPGNVQ